MKFHQRLKALRGERKLRLADIAEAVGTAPQAISQWENGDTRPDIDKLPTLAARLDVSLARLFGVEERGFQGGSAPLLDRVQAGQWTEITGPGLPSGDTRWLEPYEKPLGSAFALEIDGESMEPEFRAGDVIIVDTGLQPVPGDMVVAKLDRDNDATFKKYRPRGHAPDGAPVIELVPLNQDWPTLAMSAENPGRIIATMIEHRRFRRRRMG